MRLANLFRKSAPDVSPNWPWWQCADRIAAHPTAEAVDQLRTFVDPAGVDLDEAECRSEMIEGLVRLVELHASAPLPLLDSQHRVIGVDACHFAAPAGLAGDDQETPGKLFLTSKRLVFAGGPVRAWPWHRILDVARIERDVVVTIRDAGMIRVRFNSYSDALEARFLAQRLILDS
jgi:hypothetical protein